MLFRMLSHRTSPFLFFFFNDTATTEIYTLSLHDALPISRAVQAQQPAMGEARRDVALGDQGADRQDRKSTRLNSSHANISYAVFCLKKKKQQAVSPPGVSEPTGQRKQS